MSNENKDINDISVSSIHNMSKHSFEEVDKNDHMGGQAANFSTMSGFLQPNSAYGT
jgi:hypothetical protein